MKRVLLLGDSIRMGYDKYVWKMLEEECEVCYSADNGRFTTYTLEQAIQMFNNEGPYDIVHWNNGYWDMDVESPLNEPLIPVEDYMRFLRRIARTLKSYGAQVIFATTTPIFDDGAAEDMHTGANLRFKNEWVLRYNAAAKLVMEEEGVPVNDLYTLCLQGEKYYKCDDRLHLTEEGYQVCARQICKIIRKYL